MKQNKEKKIVSEKKKLPSVGELGYCPFPHYVSHDTVDCIVTQGAHGQAGSATILLDWATTLSRNAVTRPRGRLR